MLFSCRTVVCGLLTLFVFASIGCGSKTPAVYPASGTVKYQGKPVEGAQVSFLASGAARAASGTTDATGKFQLSTYGENDGAPAGTHTVIVVKTPASASAVEMSADDAGADYEKAMRQATYGQVQSEIPAKYGDLGQSDLRAEVKPDGENDFTFDLQ